MGQGQGQGQAGEAKPGAGLAGGRSEVHCGLVMWLSGVGGWPSPLSRQTVASKQTALIWFHPCGVPPVMSYLCCVPM